MSNSITLATSMNSVVDGFRLAGANTLTLYTTSSNVVAQSTAVTNGGWTQLTLGSLSDVLAVHFFNDNTTYSASVIAVATGSAGQNVLTTMGPGQSTYLSWSGSLTSLYAKVLNSSANGVVQYLAQQS